MAFISKPDYFRDLTIFMISSIYSFEIINAVITGPKIFFWIAAPVSDTAAVNPNGIKTLLANGVSTFFNNGLRKLRNPPSWLVIFLAVPFKKVFLFSKDLINLIYFIHLLLLSY